MLDAVWSCAACAAVVHGRVRLLWLLEEPCRPDVPLLERSCQHWQSEMDRTNFPFLILALHFKWCVITKLVLRIYIESAVVSYPHETCVVWCIRTDQHKRLLLLHHCFYGCWSGVHFYCHCIFFFLFLVLPSPSLLATTTGRLFLAVHLSHLGG